jgi:BMFP domain-containing protein YqiC
MTARNPLLDDLSRLATGALGAAQAAREEFTTFRRARMDRLVADLDLVSREEFEAVSALAKAAEAEAQALRERLARVEAALTALKGSA